MKQLKFWGLLSAVAALMLSSCADDAIPGAVGKEGRIHPAVALNTDVVSSRQSRAQASSIDANELRLTLVSADGQKTYDLGTLGEFDDTKKFPVGTYTLRAEYGSDADQGFDAPHYKGESESIKVNEGETTQVALTAGLANTMFTIAYTDALKHYLTAYSAELQAAGSPIIEYGAEETRPAYIAPGNVDVYVNITKPNGKSARLLAATVKAEARHHYYVTVDINDGEVGDGLLVISFDDALEVEDVEIDLSDELLNAPAPEVTPSTTDPIDYIETTDNAIAAKFNIIARGYLSQVKLETENAAAIAANWPESIELMGADDGQKQSLKDLGLNALGLWSNPDRMAVVDLTKVIDNITANGHSVKFTVTAVDKMGKVSDPAVIEVNVVPIKFEIGDVSDLYYGGTSFEFTLSYNGDDPDSSITYKYKNDRGTWTEVTPTSVTPGPDNTYTVVMPVPDDDNDFVFYASNGKVTTDEITVRRIASKTYAAAVKNAYATRAVIAATETDGADAGKLYGKYATLYLSTDGVTYTQSAFDNVDGYIVAKNLTPGTHYDAKVSLSRSVDEAKDVEFDTEEALQLPNYQMQDWYTEQPTTKYQIVYYPGASASDLKWGTMNLLTTSTRGTGNGVFSYGGASYRAFSGTRSTTDARSGNAAIIETVGWGKGNTAAGTTAGKCEHITAGELYLGADDATNPGNPTYGLLFASRPASLTFYYKYSAKNRADYGWAEISVYDASGNILATANKELSAASDYTAVTLALDYNIDAAKAAKIDVRFKSSANESCLEYKSENINVPAFGNYTDGRYTGSSLYIDDITLNY